MVCGAIVQYNRLLALVEQANQLHFTVHIIDLLHSNVSLSVVPEAGVIGEVCRAYNNCCKPWSKGSLDIVSGISFSIDLKGLAFSR